jgi:tRNA threonylcarbamoyladenosine modification (KEOPS) complex Cgi121 subunit
MEVKNNEYMTIEKIKGKYIYFHTFLANNHINYKQVIDELRREFPKSNIQIINRDSFLNLDHIIEVLKISLVAEERSILAARKIEMDFLMRIVGNNNIEYAIRTGGIQYDKHNILIVINNYILDTYKIKDKIDLVFGPSDDKVLFNKEEQRKKIESFRKEHHSSFNEVEMILNFMIEQAVLVTK